MYYKYLHPDRCDVICNLKIRFTQASALNDPFEAVPLVKYEDDFYYKIIPELPARTGKQLIELLNFTVGILSLSRTKENLLLWSHYADSHKGYVIEFDENNDFFKSNHEEGIDKPFLVSYTSQRPIVKSPDNEDFRCNIGDFVPEELLKILGQKPIDWAYEEEVRVFRNILKLPSSGSCKKYYEVKLVDIPPDAIIGIYLGADMEEDIQTKIIGAYKKIICISLYIRLHYHILAILLNFLFIQIHKTPIPLFGVQVQLEISIRSV